MKVTELSKHEYNSFYQTYIDKFGTKDLISGLENNFKHVLEFFNSIPMEKYEYSYDVGKWTIKELLQHLIDSERIFSYRALRIAREDKTNIPGYDHDSFVPASKANKRDFNSLVEEFILVRKSTIILFKSFSNSMLLNIGTANNDGVSVRALGFILVGHYNHHLKVIKEKYL